MDNNLSDQGPEDEDLDEDLVLTFLTDYQALEQALVQAGFTQAGRKPGDVRPDWDGFARHIQGKFDPDSEPELIGSVLALLIDSEESQHFRKRLWDPYRAEPSDPKHNTFWLAERVQQVRNQLMYGIQFVQNSGCEDVDVIAALYLLDNWTFLDPRVEGKLAIMH